MNLTGRDGIVPKISCSRAKAAPVDLSGKKIRLRDLVKEYLEDLRRIRRTLAGYRRLILITAGTMLLSVLVQMPIPFLMMVAVDHYIMKMNLKPLPMLFGCLVIYMAFGALVGLAHSLVQAILRENVLGTIQIRVFQALQNTSMSYFYDKHSGYLSSRINSDIRNVQTVLAGPLLQLAQSFLMFTGGCVCMLIISPKMALMTLAMLPVFVLVSLAFNNRMRGLSALVQESRAEVGKLIQENLTTIQVTKAFCLESRNCLALSGRLYHLITDVLGLDMTGAFSRRLTSTFATLMPIAVTWLGVHEYFAGHMSFGGVVAFQPVLQFVFNPLQGVISQNVSIQPGLVALRRLTEIRELPPETARNTGQHLSRRWNVQFRGVSFGYRPGVHVLEEADMELEEGQTTALVGPSGAGKTTILRLLLRFHDPAGGQIFLGGIDLRNLILRELRENISVVFQEPNLINDTVEANIRRGNPRASQGEVIQAARLAQAHDFISGLKDSYGTRIGENGALLSAGQRMRVAIARALIKKAPILLLDEPTSALDTQTELELITSLRRNLLGRTVLIVSHRPTVMALVDQVWRMEKGRIVPATVPTASATVPEFNGLVLR